MKSAMQWAAAAGVVLFAGAAQAQTADEAVEKALAASSPVQSLTIRIQKVEHNKPLDDSIFGRPAK